MKRWSIPVDLRLSQSWQWSARPSGSERRFHNAVTSIKTGPYLQLAESRLNTFYILQIHFSITLLLKHPSIGWITVGPRQWIHFWFQVQWVHQHAMANEAKLNSMVWVRERTIPTERPPLLREVIANFCGWRVPRSQRDGSLRPYSRFSRQGLTKLNISNNNSPNVRRVISTK
jgi:hypothetical protein